MATTPIDEQRQKEYARLHRSPEIRAQLIRALENLLEQYPHLRLGQIVVNALSGVDTYYVEDDEMLRALNQLQITYGQLRAAGIPKERL
jgi:hypothetical protein